MGVESGYLGDEGMRGTTQPNPCLLATGMSPLLFPCEADAEDEVGLERGKRRMRRGCCGMGQNDLRRTIRFGEHGEERMETKFSDAVLVPRKIRSRGWGKARRRRSPFQKRAW